MSTFIWKETSNAQRKTSNAQICSGGLYPSKNKPALTERRYRLQTSFDDLENRPLAVARGGTREQSANSVNGLTAATDNAADVSWSKLQLKGGCSTAWNFRQDHVVRKFDQLSNDELEKLSHAPERLTTNPPSHNSRGVTGEHEETRIWGQLTQTL
jgi:hypothetical protein